MLHISEYKACLFRKETVTFRYAVSVGLGGGWVLFGVLGEEQVRLWINQEKERKENSSHEERERDGICNG